MIQSMKPNCYLQMGFCSNASLVGGNEHSFGAEALLLLTLENHMKPLEVLQYVDQRSPPEYVDQRSPPEFVDQRSPPGYVDQRSPPEYVDQRKPSEMRQSCRRCHVMGVIE